MANRNGYRLTICSGLAGILVVVTTAWGSAYADDPFAQVPNLGQLGAEVAAFYQSKGQSLPPVRVAYLGVCPDSANPGLQNTGAFQHKRRLPCASSCAQDTEMAAWFRRSWPGPVELISVDWPNSGEDRSRSLRENISWSLEAKPQVLVIRENRFHADLSGDKELAAALAECWASACLPIVVTTHAETATWLPPGILNVRVIEPTVGEFHKKNNPRLARHSLTPVGISDRLLQGTELDKEHAALAYVGLTAAVLPAKGALAHLCRASLLWQAPEVWEFMGDGGEIRVTFRPLNVRAALTVRDDSTVRLFDFSTAWGSRVSDIKNFQAAGAEPGQYKPERSLLISVYGDTPLVLFDTAAQLTDLHSVYLVPGSEMGVAAFRLDERRKVSAMEDTVIPYWNVLCRGRRDAMIVSDVQSNSRVFTGHTADGAPAAAPVPTATPR